MFGGNGFINWIKEHGKQGVIGLLLAMMAAAGIAVPMNAIDNTNEAQQAEIVALQTWQVQFYEVEWPAHLEVFGILSTRVDDFHAAYVDYTELNDQNIIDINDTIDDINSWITVFYNDDPDALGEWQEFMAKWTAFYNKDTHNRGEYQKAIDALWAGIASVYQHIADLD
jgi:hypothetical protein